MNYPTQPLNLMLGTALNGRGGIASVLSNYVEAGFLRTWNVKYISTHVDGTPFEKLWSFINGMTSMIALIVCKPVHLVHIHTASDASFWRKSIIALIACILRRPVVLHVHGGGFHDFFEQRCNWFQQCYVRFVLRRCKCIVALSDKWSRLIAMIVDHPNIVTVYNPVLLPESTNHARDSMTILFLGKITRNKGIFDLLQAMAILRDEFPGIRLLCGGEGELDSLMACAEALKIKDCIECLGWVDKEHKSWCLTHSVIFALPSYAEGMPMGILEAMAAGLPVVASKVGGIPDTVRDGLEGLLVEVGDIDGLAAALGHLLRNPQYANELGHAARMRAERVFSTPSIMLQMGNIYRKLGATPVSAL